MHHKGSNGFGNGLLVGIVLGALLVLLFTTKKGRRILRILSEDGFDKFKGLEGLFDGLELDDELEGEDEYLTAMQKAELTKTHPFHRVKPTSRYHFRGVPRQVS